MEKKKLPKEFFTCSRIKITFDTKHLTGNNNCQRLSFFFLFFYLMILNLLLKKQQEQQQISSRWKFIKKKKKKKIANTFEFVSWIVVRARFVFIQKFFFCWQIWQNWRIIWYERKLKKSTFEKIKKQTIIYLLYDFYLAKKINYFYSFEVVVVVCCCCCRPYRVNNNFMRKKR